MFDSLPEASEDEEDMLGKQTLNLSRGDNIPCIISWSGREILSYNNRTHHDLFLCHF